MNDDAVRALLRLAHEDLQAAQHDLDGDFVRAALNRTYYAAFNAARAALLSEGESPRSHAGVRTRFALVFVRSRRMSPEVAEVLGVSETLRLHADYEALSVFDAKGAADLLADVVRFVDRVEEMLL